MTKTLLNTKQVASLFKVDTSTVRRWSLNGKLNSSSSNGGHRKFTYKNIIDFINSKKRNLDLDLSEINKISKKLSKKDTVDLISKMEKISKKELYKICLKIKNEKNN